MGAWVSLCRVKGLGEDSRQAQSPDFATAMHGYFGVGGGGGIIVRQQQVSRAMFRVSRSNGGGVEESSWLRCVVGSAKSYPQDI